MRFMTLKLVHLSLISKTNIYLVEYYLNIYSFQITIQDIISLDVFPVVSETVLHEHTGSDCLETTCLHEHNGSHCLETSRLHEHNGLHCLETTCFVLLYFRCFTFYSDYYPRHNIPSCSSGLKNKTLHSHFWHDSSYIINDRASFSSY